MTDAERPPVWLVPLGTVEYGRAFALQRHLLAERDAERVPDLLLLVEHPPTVTLGRRGSRDDVYATDGELAARGIALHETNRGGLVTYHGPGQVVGYPIARLRPLGRDAPTYVWRLEETLIRTLADLGVRARREDGNRGVFAEEGKVAAIGVAVSRGVTMHGFALNVRPDLDHYRLINPCGLAERGVTSVERLTGRPADPADACRLLARHFAAVFGRSVEPAPAAFWDGLSAAGFPGLAPPPPTGHRRRAPSSDLEAVAGERERRAPV